MLWQQKFSPSVQIYFLHLGWHYKPYFHFCVWLMPLPSHFCQSCLILERMWSLAAMQPQFFVWDLGSPFSQRGSHCPASAPTLHSDPWGSGTRLAKSFPALLESDPVQTMQKPPEMFWQWFAIPRAAWNSSDLSAWRIHHRSRRIWDHQIYVWYLKTLLFAKSWCRKRLTCTWPRFKPPPALHLCVHLSQC